MGNPATVVRRRFADRTGEALTRMAWSDWPIELILANEAAICGADLTALEDIARGGTGGAS